MKKIHIRKFALSRHLRKQFWKYIINDENFIECNNRFYVFNNTTVKKKFITKYYNNSLLEYFKVL